MLEHAQGGRRPGAGRPPGIPNPNAGRKLSGIRIKCGDKLLIYRRTADGFAVKSELWTILEIPSRVEIVLSSDNGDTIWIRR